MSNLTVARRPLVAVAFALLAALSSASPAWAQAGGQGDGKPAELPGGFLVPLDRVVEEMAKGLGRQYGLDDDQLELTRSLVRDHATKWVAKHADELRSLQFEGIKIATMGRPDSETIKDLSRRVKALMSDLREPIETFGNDFDGLLNDEQKARHAVERKQLKLVMDIVDLELDKMVATGKLPGPEVMNRRMAANDDAARAGRRFTGAGFLENQWEVYVKAFAAHYRLDADQVKRAEEMLSLAKKDAADYRKANEDRIKEFSGKYNALRDALAEKGLTAEARGKLLSERKGLDAEADRFEVPLREMFDKLKEALDTLPTEAQKTKSGAFPLRSFGSKKPTAG
jgi:hypothetical protein